MFLKRYSLESVGHTELRLNKKFRAGELAQWFRALVKDLSLVPSTHSRCPMPPTGNSSSEESNAFSGLHRHCSQMCRRAHTCACTHIN